MALQTVRLDKVITGLNNREDFPQAHIEALAEDIKTNGIIFAPVYRPCPDGTYQCVAGECRTRAAKLLGWVEIIADVRTLTDAEALRVMYVENNKRKDTNPIENAKFYKRYATEQNMLDDKGNVQVGKLALALAVSDDMIRRRLSLLALNSQYQDLLIKGVITLDAAESLAKLDNNRQRLCYQKWLALRDEDRSGERLAVLAKHYRTMQDEEAAKEAQGSLFDDPLFTGQPIACSWDDLRAKMAIAQPVKVDHAAILAERDALAKELADLKALVVANVTKERAKAAAEQERIKAENKKLKQQLAKMWNIKAPKATSNDKLVAKVR